MHADFKHRLYLDAIAGVVPVRKQRARLARRKLGRRLAWWWRWNRPAIAALAFDDARELYVELKGGQA